FRAMQMGMHPRTRTVLDVLSYPVRLVPISIRRMPHGSQNRRDGWRFGVAESGCEFFNRHHVSTWLVRSLSFTPEIGFQFLRHRSSTRSGHDRVRLGLLITFLRSVPMKRGFFMVMVWCAVGSAFAQAPAGQQISLATSLQRGYATVKQNLTEEIAKMPEENFSFKPGPAPELRNFGMLSGHVPNAQFGSCSAALGQPNPNQGHNLETEATTKAALTKALADSFALCDKAFAGLTDQNAMEMVKQGQN